MINVKNLSMPNYVLTLLLVIFSFGFIILVQNLHYLSKGAIPTKINPCK